MKIVKTYAKRLIIIHLNHTPLGNLAGFPEASFPSLFFSYCFEFITVKIKYIADITTAAQKQNT
jgi:hypothetical protein